MTAAEQFRQLRDRAALIGEDAAWSAKHSTELDHNRAAARRWAERARLGAKAAASIAQDAIRLRDTDPELEAAMIHLTDGPRDLGATQRAEAVLDAWGIEA